ncbi:oxidoreductase, short chain dehydrogenase/reductase family protein [Brugia malayi]|uniref:Oxidoreductase, short chain dehydrogenase/reductase family protein n=1 Tax=Brugia malayi TaxID=6279 RepID=A0A4E9F7T5_BRUMA|nr:oxidoreductase, short chain dehydrogenase/reductase family protein [Brugia malayi]VIO92096.1 oxidoreductase, short chain dehydrogenase/reductase family protein [Brugia malayi]
MTFTGRKVLAIITGASRGIGRETVLQLSKIVAKGSAFLITARTAAKLEELRDEIKSSVEGIDIHVLVCDAEKLNSGKILELQGAISSLIANSRTYDVLLLVHNAGTVGDITKRGVEIINSDDWHSYLQINFVSVVLINNSVLSTIPERVAPARYILNVTSLLAVKAFPSMVQYSVGKAAREAFFRALAVEESNLRILNYSPGPVQTDMHNEIAKRSYDEGIRESFKAQADSTEVNRRTLSPKETVEKMLSILEEDKFESGSRYDFFDF